MSIKKDNDNIQKELSNRADMLTASCMEMQGAINQTLAANVEYIKTAFNLNQNELANYIGCASSMLTRLKAAENNPSLFPLLYKLSRLFDFTIDELLFTDLMASGNAKENQDDLPEARRLNLKGLYQIYYYDTSAFKGREYKETADALKSGLLLCCSDLRNRNHIRCAAIFNMKKEEADALYKETKLQSGEDNRWNYLTSRMGRQIYYGEMENSEKNIYISLRYKGNWDRVQMIFHYPQTNSSQYIGGLGNMVSVSKGRMSSPCVQYVALSLSSLNVASEEIGMHLLMHYPNFKTYEGTEDVADMVIKLYQKDTGDDIGEADKRQLLRIHIDEIVNATVEKNLFRSVIVSDRDDDDFYHYLKRVRMG